MKSEADKRLEFKANLDENRFREFETLRKRIRELNKFDDTQEAAQLEQLEQEYDNAFGYILSVYSDFEYLNSEESLLKRKRVKARSIA